jgi:hypothetical protein
MLLNEAHKDKFRYNCANKGNKRIVTAVASVVFLLVATTLFVVTKGFDFVKIMFWVILPKKLLEGEWIVITEPEL